MIKYSRYIIIFLVYSFMIFPNNMKLLKIDLQDVPPKFILSPNNEYSGISFDIMKLVEESSKYKFSYNKTLIPISRVVENLKHGLTDVQFGLQKTPEREKNLIYGPELYKIKIIGLVKKNSDYKINSLNDLKKQKIKILTQYGTAVDYELKRLGNLNIDSGGKSLENNLEKLMLNRGDIIIYHDLSIYYLINLPKYKNKFKVIEIDFQGNKELDEVGQFLVFSSKVPKTTRDEISYIIENLKKSGKIDKILKEYIQK